MSTLVLDGIRKRFGDVVALDGLDLVVEDGELVVLLGPQGAGATTALRVAAGMERPDEGLVRIDGVDVTTAKPSRRGVVLVQPRDELPPKRTAEQIIRAGARGRGVKRSEVPGRVSEGVNLARCEPALDHRADRLTLEGRRRVLLARAFAARPGVLLIDEPLLGLDEAARRRVLDDLAAAHERAGRTTVHAASDAAEAMALGGRIALLRDGALEQVGTAEDLYDRPVSRFAAEFVATEPLNVLPASVRGGRLHAGPFSFALRGEDDRHVDRPLEVGIRPEHIAIAPPKGGSGAVVAAVRMTPAGAYLEVEAGEDRLLVRADAHLRPRVGAHIKVSARRSHAFLFDAETGVTFPAPG